MRTIELTQGKVAIVDDDDYEALSKHKWCAERKGRTYYAVRGRSRRDPSYGHGNIKMHIVIAGAAPGMVTDHIDGDGLNNLRANLRTVTQAQNLHNTTRKQGGCRSLYRGVSWATRERRWRASLQANGTRIELGYFRNEVDAAAAYDAAWIERDPEHFTPNFSASLLAPCRGFL